MNRDEVCLKARHWPPLRNVVWTPESSPSPRLLAGGHPPMFICYLQPRTSTSLLLRAVRTLGVNDSLEQSSAVNAVPDDQAPSPKSALSRSQLEKI